MQTIFQRSLLTASLTVFSGFSLFGCAEQDASPLSDEALDYAVVGELTWSQCATQGNVCKFTGTRQVRYGAGSRFVTRSFTGSATCANWVFGVKFGTGNACYLGTETSADAGMNMADSGAMNMADSGAMNMADGGTMNMADSGTAPMSGMGPTIDRSKIPTGNPGVSGVELMPTTDRPGASDGTGAFRTKCGFSHMLFDDPIVFPGQPGASHLHAFFGNSLASASSTQSSIRNTGNSTCRGGTANRTAYWVPALIDANGAPLKPATADMYYKTGYNGIAPADIHPFPSGLRMIAGDAKSSSAQEHSFWGCHDNYIGHPGSIPTCPLGDQVVMYVMFPQCWDGVNLDSSDHKSHMAYPSNGQCPSTHPVAIPEISFNIYYDVPNGNTTGWRLASDMYDSSKPGGFSAHGDYFEGWDPAIVQTFIKNCDNPGVDCHEHLLGDGRMMYNSME